MTRRAVALFSGGLDSTLAVLTILRQDIKVKAIKFRTPFDIDISPTMLHSYVSPSPTPPVKGGEIVGIAPVKGGKHIPTPYPADCRRVLSRVDLPSPLAGEGKGEGYRIFSNADRFGFEVKLIDLSDRFIEIVKNPEHSYGKNMNPCIDCRILMLKEAKKIMDRINAEFIITGEVTGQRPMSQRKDMLYHIDKEAGVTGYIVRPLSAKLLRNTIPEEKGILDREMFYDFSGRSRKKQMALAKEFGLKDYPAPAGGCLLTEPNFAYRLKDLLNYNPAPHIRDIYLLKTGRHFRYSPSCKIIVGRDKYENEIIESLSKDTDYLLEVEGFASPITLVTGEVTEEALNIAASICAMYSDAKNLSRVEVIVMKWDDRFSLRVPPAGNKIIEALRISKNG
jgi:tRNA-uridine 2-sulfurtransferase